MTNKVQQALRHVKEHHPEVTQVFYGTDGRWQYCGEAFERPKFGDEVDVSILEDAADSVKSLPAAFRAKGEKCSFLVTWEVDMYAETPADAARMAFAIMKKPGTTATVFKVFDEEGESTIVDILEEEDERN